LWCFFFSSRRRHTRSLRDWSSDVCSSDLRQTLFGNDFHGLLDGNMYDAAGSIDPLQFFIGLGVGADLFAQIGLRIGFLPRETKTLEPRLRRQFPLMSLARWRRTHIGRNRISG